MKILVDLTPLYNRKETGLEIYGIEFYKSLLKTGHDIFPIFRVKNTIDKNKNSIIIPYKNRILVENYYLTRIIKRLNPDIAFFPIFPPPLNIYTKGIKIIPTIHDLVFLKFKETMSFKARLYLVPKYKKALKSADEIITISETVKKEISDLDIDIPINNLKENISMEYADFCDINKEYLNKWNLKEDSYVISVSTVEPRKNLNYLFNVWENVVKIYPNLKLVLVGRHGWNGKSNLENSYEKVKDSVVFTGYVENDELKSLYRFSKAFILLSLYEGFGRTPLEALACNARVMVSDIPIFHETLKDNAIYLPLNDSQKAAEFVSKEIQKKKNVIPYSIKLPFNVLETNLIEFLDNYGNKSM